MQPGPKPAITVTAPNWRWPAMKPATPKLPANWNFRSSKAGPTRAWGALIWTAAWAPARPAIRGTRFRLKWRVNPIHAKNATWDPMCRHTRSMPPANTAISFLACKPLGTSRPCPGPSAKILRPPPAPPVISACWSTPMRRWWLKEPTR